MVTGARPDRDIHAAAGDPGPALTASDLLALHDSGAALDVIGRTLLLASWRNPDGEDASRMPLGRRDRAVLDLFRATFGGALDAVADCAACTARLDVELDASTLLLEADAAAPRQFADGPWTVTVRPLDTRDLQRAGRSRDVAAIGSALADAAIVRATHDGIPIAPHDLPPEIVAAAGEAVAALDPMAEIVLDLACPSCGGRTPVALDVGGFVWTVVERAATDLLDEVSVLAGRYGWSERDILAMSRARRSHYLDRVA